MAKSNGQTIDDLYTSFETSDIQGSKMLARAFAPQLGFDAASTTNLFSEIFKLLFPASPGAILSAEQFWKKFTELSTASFKTEAGKDPRPGSGKRQLAKLMRVYTYAPSSSGSDDLSNNIDRKSTRLNSSHVSESRMPSSA